METCTGFPMSSLPVRAPTFTDGCGARALASAGTPAFGARQGHQGSPGMRVNFSGKCPGIFSDICPLSPLTNEGFWETRAQP
jgi:hypothetical protein